MDSKLIEQDIKSVKRSSYYARKRRSTTGTSQRPNSFLLSNNTSPALSLSNLSTSTTLNDISPTSSDNLENPSKDELIGKLVSELDVKNKLIYELKNKENWLSAELVSRDRGEKTDGLKLIQEDEEKKDVFSSLLFFKAEIERAKVIVDENATTLQALQREKLSLEQELSHARALLNTTQDPKEIQAKRINELESKLRSSLLDISDLQSKVSLWTRSSKRNHDARIQSESCQRTLELEIRTLQKINQGLNMKMNEIKLIEPVVNNDERITELEKLLNEKKELIRFSESRIAEFESSINQIVGTLQELERENANLRVEKETFELRMEETSRGNTDKIQELELELKKQRERYEYEIDQMKKGEDINDRFDDLNKKLEQGGLDKKAAEDAKDLMESALSHSQETINELENALKYAESSLELADDEKNLLIKELKIKDDNISAISEELAALKSKPDNSERIQELENEKEILLGRIQELESKLDGFDIDAVKNVLKAEFKEELTIKEAEIEELALEMKESNNMIDLLQNEIKEAQNKLEQIQTIRSQNNEEKDQEKDRELAAIQEEMEKLKETLKEEDINQLERQLLQGQEKIKEAMKEKEEIQESLNQLTESQQRKINTLMAGLEELTEFNEEVSLKLGTSQSEKVVLMEEIEVLRGDYAQLQEKVVALTNTLVDIKRMSKF